MFQRVSRLCPPGRETTDLHWNQIFYFSWDPRPPLIFLPNHQLVPKISWNNFINKQLNRLAGRCVKQTGPHGAHQNLCWVCLNMVLFCEKHKMRDYSESSIQGPKLEIYSLLCSTIPPSQLTGEHRHCGGGWWLERAAGGQFDFKGPGTSLPRRRSSIWTVRRGAKRVRQSVNVCVFKFHKREALLNYPEPLLKCKCWEQKGLMIVKGSIPQYSKVNYSAIVKRLNTAREDVLGIAYAVLPWSQLKI